VAKKTKRRVVMILLDSNIFIYLSKGMIDIDAVLTEDDSCAISVITYMEVLGYGFNSDDEEKIINKLLSLFNIIYVDESIAKMVVNIRKERKIKLPDAIICATAIVNSATLISNDIRLQTIQNLKFKTVRLD